MKTCNSKLVFDAVTRKLGLEPTTAGFTPAQKANIAEIVNERLKTAWEDALWPDTLNVEQRRYRATWDAELTYALNEEVWYETGGEGSYYKSLQAANINQNPVTEVAYWSEITETDEFIRYIEFEQDGETPIDGIDAENCIFSSDPRVYEDRGLVRGVRIIEDKIIIRADQAPEEPWIRFRPVCPEFSWTEWSDSTAYSIGDLVYLAAYGESYKAIASSTNKNPYSETAYWEPVQFPRIFKTYVTHAAHADLLTEDDGKYKAEAKATQELERLQDTNVDQKALRGPACYRRS